MCNIGNLINCLSNTHFSMSFECKKLVHVHFLNKYYFLVTRVRLDRIGVKYFRVLLNNARLVGKRAGAMVVSCCAHGCRNRYGERPGLGFFRFPMQHGERKKRWILAVRRKSWNPTKHTRICGDHFVSGERIHGACGTEITRQYCCSGKPVEEPESVDYSAITNTAVITRSDVESREEAELIDGGRYLKSLKL